MFITHLLIVAGRVLIKRGVVAKLENETSSACSLTSSPCGIHLQQQCPQPPHYLETREALFYTSIL